MSMLRVIIFAACFIAVTFADVNVNNDKEAISNHNNLTENVAKPAENVKQELDNANLPAEPVKPPVQNTQQLVENIQVEQTKEQPVNLPQPVEQNKQQQDETSQKREENVQKSEQNNEKSDTTVDLIKNNLEINKESHEVEQSTKNDVQATKTPDHDNEKKDNIADLRSIRQSFNTVFYTFEKDFLAEYVEINQTFKLLFANIYKLYDGPETTKLSKEHLIFPTTDKHMILNILSCAEIKKHPIIDSLNAISECKNEWPNENQSKEIIIGIYTSTMNKMTQLMKKQEQCSNNCPENLKESIKTLVEKTIPEAIKEMQRYHNILHQIPIKMKLCAEDIKDTYKAEDTLKINKIQDCAIWKTRKQSLLCRISISNCEISKFVLNLIPWSHHHYEA